ncbi:MAG: right-handed parallel beta-helix repeat-containing protein [Pseudomonadota bacterium]
MFNKTRFIILCLLLSPSISLALTVAAFDAPDVVKATADYICDGVDDQIEINQALAFDINGPKRTVNLSAGTFNITIHDDDGDDDDDNDDPNDPDYAILMQSNVSLVGEGRDLTKIILVGNNFLYGNTIFSNNLVNTTISDFELDGDWQSGINNSAQGITIRRGSNNKILNVHIKNFSLHSIELSGANNLTIDSIETSNVIGSLEPSHGIDIDISQGASQRHSTNIFIRNSIISNPGGDATKVENADGVRYENNVFTERVVVSNDSSNNFDSLFLKNIYFKNNTFSDILLIGHRDNPIDIGYNTFDKNGYIHMALNTNPVQVHHNIFQGTNSVINPHFADLSENTGMTTTTTKHVSTVSTGIYWNTPPFITPKTAASTIQTAINAAKHNDIILLKDGIYKGAGNVNVSTATKVLTITSENGAEKTIIDAESAPNTTIFKVNSNSRIENLTLIGGNRDYDGGAIDVNSVSPTLSNLIILNSTAELGGAIRLHNSNSIVENVIFRNNKALDKSGAFARGGAIFIDGTSSPIISYCIFDENSANQGSAIYSRSTGLTTVLNSTFYTSSPDNSSFYLNNTSLDLSNTIVWGNQPFLDGIGTNTTTVRYSNTLQLQPGVGNTSQNPLFTDPTNNDFSLLNNSPLIDAGLDVGLTQDIFGNLIHDVLSIDNTGDTGAFNLAYVDIGAVEYITPAPDDTDNDGIPDDLEREVFGDLDTTDGSGSFNLNQLLLIILLLTLNRLKYSTR